MSKLSRWIKHCYWDFHGASRRRELEQAAGDALGQHLRFKRVPFGGRGKDLAYYVLADGQRIGMARVMNSNSHTKAASDVDRVRTRILAREWDMYQRLGPSGLSPKALWRSDDVFLCSYIDGTRMSAIIRNDPSQFWPQTERGIHALHQLHEHGVSHMDAKLDNMILEASSGRVVFVDFETEPGPDMDFTAQKTFDYLHVVDFNCRAKVIRPVHRAEAYRWVTLLDSYVDEACRNVDIKPMRPALGNLYSETEVCRHLRTIFPSL